MGEAAQPDLSFETFEDADNPAEAGSQDSSRTQQKDAQQVGAICKGKLVGLFARDMPLATSRIADSAYYYSRTALAKLAVAVPELKDVDASVSALTPSM